MVLAEVDAYARRQGGHPERFADLAGTGDGTQALDDLPLLAVALREDGIDAPAVAGLADVVAGRVEPERWAAAAMEPNRDAAEAGCLSRLPCVDKVQLDQAFSELYRAHLRDVYSYSYYRVGNHHDAEDLTEQTFLQAYRHFERAQWESDGRPLRPWLIRIAHNLAANLYRDRARKPQTPIEDTGTLSARCTRPRTSSRAGTSWRGSWKGSRSCRTTAGRR